MNNKLMERELSRIIQDPKIVQYIHKETSKAIQLNVVIQINGDSAIDRVCADEGDIAGAMRYILSLLPHPRILNLGRLAMVVAADMFRTKKGKGIAAAEYLGVTPNTYYCSVKQFPVIRQILESECDGDDHRPESPIDADERAR